MYGKLVITCDLVVKTGMHIGGTDAFSAIGAVDSPVVRDPRTGRPIVPGSSLKGKLRTLLARSVSRDITDMPPFDKDDPVICRLFGTADPPKRARLQFSDCFVTNYQQMKAVGVTEVKTENTINRTTSKAMPRQIERVTAGTVFGVAITYEVENLAQVEEDLTLLAKGMKLLQLDYLGGHGSRGSGRVSLRKFKFDNTEAPQVDIRPLENCFNDEVASYELFPDSAAL